MNMKIKIIFLLLALSAVFASCKKELPKASTILTHEKGWRLQQYTIFSRGIHDDLNSKVLAHYKNLGTFIFSEDNTGKYKYQEEEIAFTWKLESNWLNFKFDAEDVSSYASPFIYYYFSGNEGGSPYWENEKMEDYELEVINPFTIVAENEHGGYSSSESFNGIQILMTKEE